MGKYWLYYVAMLEKSPGFEIPKSPDTVVEDKNKAERAEAARQKKMEKVLDSSVANTPIDAIAEEHTEAWTQSLEDREKGTPLNAEGAAFDAIAPEHVDAWTKPIENKVAGEPVQTPEATKAPEIKEESKTVEYVPLTRAEIEERWKETGRKIDASDDGLPGAKLDSVQYTGLVQEHGLRGIQLAQMDKASKEVFAQGTSLAPVAPAGANAAPEVKDLVEPAAVQATKLTPEQDPLREDIRKAAIGKYLSYQDTEVEDGIKKSILEDSVADDATRKYADSLLEMGNKYTLPELERTGREMKDKALDILSKLGIEPSSLGKSDTWAMWDLGKQFYYASNPDKAEGGYAIADPMASEEKRNEIIDRQVGWEAYNAYQLNDKKFLQGLQQAEKDSIIKYLMLAPKSNNTLSSKHLAELGTLLRKIAAPKPPTSSESLQGVGILVKEKAKDYKRPSRGWFSRIFFGK